MSLVIITKTGATSGISVVSTCQSAADMNVSDFQTDFFASAVDIDIENSLIALGTGCGNINLVGFTQDANSIICTDLMNLFQASRVLSICMAGNDRIISSGPKGKNYLWHLNAKGETPAILDSAGSTVISLHKVADDTIAGLGDCGKLLFWDIDKGKIVFIIDCPMPHPTSANLHYWPSGKCLLYQSTEGALIVYNLENASWQTVDAHPGQVFSILVSNNHIYTIGSEDGLLKKYYDINSQNQKIYKVPRNIVSAGMYSETAEQFLFVNSEGKAGTYGFDGEELNQISSLKGDFYHAVKTPDPNYQRVSAAAAIKADIEDCILSEKMQGLDHKYNQLKDLGFSLTALALKVSAAQRAGDIVRSLSALKEIAGFLYEGDDIYYEYLSEYVKVLEETWHPLEALDIYRQINIECNEKTKYLSKASEIISNESYVVDTDIGIDKLIEAASIMEKKFKGLWIINRKSSLPIKEIGVEQIFAQYKNIKEDKFIIRLPFAKVIHPFWLAQRTIAKTEMVIFSKLSEFSSAGLVYGIRIEKNVIGSSFTPVILFNAGQSAEETGFSAHNETLKSIYRHMLSGQLADQWPNLLFKTVRDAIQRANTCAANSRG